MDFYVILGLERGATLADVKRAYKRLARRFHPDINPGDRMAASLAGADAAHDEAMRIRLAAILLQTGVHSPQGREQIEQKQTAHDFGGRRCR